MWINYLVNGAFTFAFMILFLLGIVSVLLFSVIVLSYNPKQSKQKNENEIIKSLNLTVLVCMGLITVLFGFSNLPIAWDYTQSPRVRAWEYEFAFMTILSFFWGTIIARFIALAVYKLMIICLDKLTLALRSALKYEDRTRQAQINIKTRKGEELMTAWVIRETPRYLYVEDEKTGREHRIKKALIGHDKYPVKSLDVRHIINAI